MASFQYTAKQRTGESVSSTIQADSLAAARQQLRREGLFVLEIHPLGQADVAASSNWNLGGPRRVKKTDLMMMLSQLNIMCQSGVDIAEAIHNVSQNITNVTLQEILETVHEDISAGVSFSEALSRHPQVFDSALVAGISAGEQSGNINSVLKRLTELIRGDIRLRATVWSMLMYPIVLCVVTVLVLGALVFFVLPQFAKVFADLGKPAPPITQLMLDFGEAVNTHRMLVLGLLGGLFVAVALLRKTALMRRFFDHASLHFAIVRKSTRALLTGRSFRLLGSMLASGVPLLDGIRLCRDSIQNRLFRDMFDQVEHDVLHGEGIGKPLLEARCLPAGAAQMVATAERSGNLGEVLQSVGEYFEEEGERSIRDLVKILEPAVIVVLGVIVAGVVLSVVLPLLDVSSVQH
ncbi:type II secretion system F family protein [Roseimaritima ulvae]|uniref:Type II secretion system protein F n=1 Tax=Roseimaritima ulvae TaxID=980254 RepID=A0A5B9R958_9BACT|nr:type II secretion system F family protein [Roseimaritima ulvae]QEG43481.1 Type II secretion system protein F [Roseimaritima ulvae]